MKSDELPELCRETSGVEQCWMLRYTGALSSSLPLLMGEVNSVLHARGAREAPKATTVVTAFSRPGALLGHSACLQSEASEAVMEEHALWLDRMPLDVQQRQ